MKKLTVILFWLCFGAPVQALNFNPTVPETHITACRNLAHGVFYSAAGGAPREVLREEIEGARKFHSFLQDLEPSELEFLTNHLSSEVYYHLGRVKMDRSSPTEAMDDFQHESCSGTFLLFWR